MRVPNAAHESLPWRIHEITRDFRLEDVWSLPTPGGRDELPQLVELVVYSDPSRDSALPARALWSIREKLGELLGWDRAEDSVGSRVQSLRDRLPADLRDGPRGPEFDRLPFRPLYLTDDEWAAEIANRTVHGVLHVGWVPDGQGYHGQMAVYVKLNGPLGVAYLAAIRPARHLVVYPLMMRQLERRWRERGGERVAAPA
jgi:Protein of unknown function (DUF2867)